MEAQVDVLEERLNSLLSQLQAEYGILDRLVYKNKNQHRRCSYFQYLSKVRRDLRLLQSAHLEDLFSSCINVITGKRPKQKVHLLESLKKRKCDGGKNTFLERLMGAARLLCQMVEPMLKAAIEISTLLARSFFMGFSLTVLALLARLRVLVQQILLDIVSVFNTVSSLSQNKQDIKISQDGFVVFREFYPTATNKEIVVLECLWETDKFVLHERTHRSETNNQDGELGREFLPESSAVQYQSIDLFLGDDEITAEKAGADNTTIEPPTQFKEEVTIVSVAEPFIDATEEKQIEGSINKEDKLAGIARLQGGSKSIMSVNSSTIKSGPVRKVAFLSVKRPAPSTGDLPEFNVKQSKIRSGDKEDPLFYLLTDGNLKESIF